jgi:hypothetical protein
MTWNQAYTSTFWPSVCTVLLLLALSFYGWRRRSVLVTCKGIAGKCLCGRCNRPSDASFFDGIEICVTAVEPYEHTA